MKIKYPKFLLLIFTFVLAYLIFRNRESVMLKNFLLSSGYFGAFLTGLGFSYGFTSAPATAIFLILAKQQNILLSGFIGGLGALFSDLIIFKFVRYSFSDEIEKLSKEKPIKVLNHKIKGKLKEYLLTALAGFIIASPLPDEVGVSLLAVSKSISTKFFSLFSYIMNTAGIFVILFVGRAI